MPRRNFMWTTLGLVTGVTGGASFGAAVNNETPVVDGPNQAKKKGSAKEAEASNKQKLHQAQEQSTTEQTPAVEKSSDDSRPETKNPPNTVSVKQARNIRDGALTGGVIGMAGGYYVDEAFHHLALGSHEIDSRRRY